MSLFLNCRKEVWVRIASLLIKVGTKYDWYFMPTPINNPNINMTYSDSTWWSFLRCLTGGLSDWQMKFLVVGGLGSLAVAEADWVNWDRLVAAVVGW